VRGVHGFVVLAEEGDSFNITVKVRRLGRYLDSTTAVLFDPHGEETATEVAGVGADKTIAVETAQAGVYNLVVNTGANACWVYCDARNFALWGDTPHFLSATPRLYFLPRAGAKSFELTLRTDTDSPGETATLTVYDPEGNAVAEGDTVTHKAGYAALVAVPEQFTGKPWSFRLGKAEEGVCEDNQVRLGGDVLPFLATHPSRLVLPE